MLTLKKLIDILADNEENDYEETAKIILNAFCDEEIIRINRQRGK